VWCFFSATCCAWFEHSCRSRNCSACNTPTSKFDRLCTPVRSIQPGFNAADSCSGPFCAWHVDTPTLIAEIPVNVYSAPHSPTTVGGETSDSVTSTCLASTDFQPSGCCFQHREYFMLRFFSMSNVTQQLSGASEAEIMCCRHECRQYCLPGLALHATNGGSGS
jgi:hypothetical protein